MRCVRARCFEAHEGRASAQQSRWNASERTKVTRAAAQVHAKAGKWVTNARLEQRSGVELGSSSPACRRSTIDSRIFGFGDRPDQRQESNGSRKAFRLVWAEKALKANRSLGAEVA
jgi:hypothetical protein